LSLDNIYEKNNNAFCFYNDIKLQKFNKHLIFTAIYVISFIHKENLTEYIFNIAALLVYNYVCFMYLDIIYIYTNVFAIVMEGNQTL